MADKHKHGIAERSTHIYSTVDDSQTDAIQDDVFTTEVLRDIGLEAGQRTEIRTIPWGKRKDRTSRLDLTELIKSCIRYRQLPR